MADPKHWYWEYVVKDWIADTGPLKELTRAFWHEALCRMWLNDRCGEISGSYEDLASLCRSQPNNARAAIADLQKCNAADITVSGAVVTLVNRRMKREYLDRKSLRERVDRHRRRKRGELGNDGCNGDVTDIPKPNPQPYPQPQPNPGGAGGDAAHEGSGVWAGQTGNLGTALSREQQLALLDQGDSSLDRASEVRQLLASLKMKSSVIDRLIGNPSVTVFRINSELRDIDNDPGAKNRIGCLAHRLGYRKKRG